MIIIFDLEKNSAPFRRLQTILSVVNFHNAITLRAVINYLLDFVQSKATRSDLFLFIMKFLWTELNFHNLFTFGVMYHKT